MIIIMIIITISIII